jgi:hypothetical protein
MLVLVLTVSYKLILDCLEADRIIDKVTLPEKVGDGILSLLRNDLAGVMYRNLGRRIFFVADNGVGYDSTDEIRFITTVEPTPREEAGYGESVTVAELRTIMGVSYFLRPSQDRDLDVPAFTLFRKEMVELDEMEPLASLGVAYEIYDKVAYLSIECFDGWGWYQDWDSEMRIEQELLDLEAEAAAMNSGGVARVSDPQGASASTVTTPGVSPYEEEGGLGSELLPPAAIPLAVRVEVGIYVATRSGVELDYDGSPLIKTYSTIVPILSAQRLAMEFEEGLGMGEEGLASTAGGEAGAAPVIQVRGQPLPNQPGAGRGGRGGRGGRMPGEFGRGGRGGGRGGMRPPTGGGRGGLRSSGGDRGGSLRAGGGFRGGGGRR